MSECEKVRERGERELEEEREGKGKGEGEMGRGRERESVCVCVSYPVRRLWSRHVHGASLELSGNCCSLPQHTCTQPHTHTRTYTLHTTQ